MDFIFSKYHGAGNDFIIADAINQTIDFSTEEIARLCHRRFGVGADGFMLLLPSYDADFEMKYYNSDGREGSMCGNGGRCIVAFAKQQGIINDITEFNAIDGKHHAQIFDNGSVRLAMKNVESVTTYKDGWFVDTGSPHFVQQVNNLSEMNVIEHGKTLRFDKRFQPKGTNVNFIEIKNDIINIRTFERGVENETLACGTGAVAAAIVAMHAKLLQATPITIQAKGGVLSVECDVLNNDFTNIWLTGPTAHVFDGEINP